MSFTRANPTGWAVGDKLTSTQTNTLDIDHSNSLDKSTAGDTILGTVSVGSTGKVTSTIVGGVTSGVAGGIALTAGATDFITISPTRTITRSVPMSAIFGSGLSSYSGNIQNGATQTNTAGSTVYINLNPFIPDGVTLTSMVLSFFPSVSYNGAAKPGNGVTLDMVRNLYSLPVTGTNSMHSTGQVQDSLPATGTLYYNSGAVRQVTYPVDQLNVIDKSQYLYCAVFTGEFGTNVQTGTQYVSLQLTMSISSMKF